MMAKFRIGTAFMLMGATGVGLCAQPAADTAPVASALPTCVEMGEVLGPLVVGLTPETGEDSVSGPFRGDRDYGVACNWMTPKLLSDDADDALQGGVFGVTISVDVKRPSTSEREIRLGGMLHDDPAVRALGGYVIALPSAEDMDLSEQATIAPLVVVGKVTIGVTALGQALQESKELQDITNQVSIDTAVKLHRLLLAGHWR